MKRHYVVMVDVGYGHDEPIHFDAEPFEALATAYEYFLNDELTEGREFEEDDMPHVFEVHKVAPDADLFAKLLNAKNEEEDAYYEASRKKDQLEREAKAAVLIKLSPEDKKILGIG